MPPTPSLHLFEPDEPKGPPDEPVSSEHRHFARVAVERRIDAHEGLTYAHEGDLSPGDRVRVPLASGSSEGVVIAVGGPELLAGLDPKRVRRATRLDTRPVPAGLIELADWISRYYVTPIGLVLGSMIPRAVKAGVGRRSRTVVEPAEQIPAELPTLTPSAGSAWEALQRLDASTFPLAARDLAALVGASNVAPINALVRAGLLVEREITFVRTPAEFDLPLGLEPGDVPTTTPEQNHVIEGVASTLGSFATHLLFGVTGSGKTEVYLRLIDRVAAAGKSAIVLVPEIALTPQTAARFLARFKQAGVAVLHSGLSASARHKQWAAAATGEARVVIGPRSAVFAPTPELALIVVDEEHDASYKQDRAPRYHARDVAIKRAQLAGCPVLLGSATPSLETYANARAGKAAAWSLPHRVAGAQLPRVQLVDLARERTPGVRTPDAVGPTPAARLEQTLKTGGQAILLLNRRGFAAVVACADPRCGWTLGCQACDTTMVVHGRTPGDQRRYVRCHHCLSEQKRPTLCPVCDKPTIELGAGTQRVEQELERRFGDTLGLRTNETFARVDADTMTRARDYFAVLDRFARGELRLLVDTQMLAKGLDFPNVRLVGVLNADTGMAIPDFRASERTFQLVCQVAGRAGRGADPGEVVVQTYNPDDPALVLASQHRVTDFLAREAQLRHSAGLPPFRRMARVVCRDTDPERAHERAGVFADFLRTLHEPDLEILGPAPCPIARINNHHRVAVTLTAPGAGTVQRALHAARARGLVGSASDVAIDVDPVALL